VIRKQNPVDSIELQVVESGELSAEDVDALAEFVARIAYNNLKKAQESAQQLIQTTLNERNDESSSTK